MDPIYQQLINREVERVEALRRRIQRHEERIATLQQLAEDDVEDGSSVRPQPIKIGSRAVGEPHGADGTHEGRHGAEFRDPQRVISDANRFLLIFIGDAGKTLDEMERFADANGLNMNRGAIRSFANIYRNRFGFLESPEASRYRLTARGQRYLAELPPPSGASGAGPENELEEEEDEL